MKRRKRVNNFELYFIIKKNYTKFTFIKTIFGRKNSISQNFVIFFFYFVLIEFSFLLIIAFELYIYIIVEFFLFLLIDLPIFFVGLLLSN